MLKVTVKPVAVGVKPVTARPRVVIAAVEPVTSGGVVRLARSLTVRVWLPPVLRVTLKTPTPLVSVASAGKTALVSLLVKCTLPP